MFDGFPRELPRFLGRRAFIKTCATHVKKTAPLAEWVRDNVSGGM